VHDDWLQPLSNHPAAASAEAVAFSRDISHNSLMPSTVIAAFPLHYSETLLQCSKSFSHYGGSSQHRCLRCRHYYGCPSERSVPRSDHREIKEAPDTIKGVSTDLRVIQPVLQSLVRTVQDSPSEIVLSEQIKHAVVNCERACGTFLLQVEHWMEHSTEDKMFWMDRWEVGLFGLERIKTFRGQLSDCKGTLSVALSTATMYLCPVVQVYVVFSDMFQHYNIPSRAFDARDEGHDAPTE
jgi:hypothetical protein